MLDLLRVRSFAIIDELEVRFGPGLNALTGETGAGKSILVDALHLVLGGRAQADSVRTGAAEAEVEALFRPRDPRAVDERLEALGLPSGGDELLIRRTVQKEGRSRAFVNGALATATQLAQLTRGLLDISGQHEHVGLLDAGSHLALLDAHAQLTELRLRYGASHAQLAEVERQRAQLGADESQRLERIDWLEYQLDELEKASLSSGEEAALAQERKLLAAAEKLRAGAEEAFGLLTGEPGAAVETAAKALRRLDDLAAIDPALAPLAASVRGAWAELSEAGRSLSKYAARAGGDPARLESIEERLELLHKLARKHGGSVEKALERALAMRKELDQLENHDSQRASLDERFAALAAQTRALAAELSAKRRAAADRFSSAVASELAALGMARSQLAVRFGPVSDGGVRVEEGLLLGPAGAETAELLLSPNPGEELRPLARIASGGELSRVLLAVKRVLSETDPVDTYLFDEVDAGIGGATADAVGRALWTVARRRQVVCITHLPQIAVFADAHQVVEKEIAQGRTQSRVQPVDGEGRVRELARLLSGQATPLALEHARELLSQAARAVAPVEPARSRSRRSAAVS